MATIRVRSSVPEDALFQEQWQAFAADLRAAGHEVEGVGHSGQFSRSLPPDLPDPRTIVIVIWLAKKLAGETVDAVLTEVRDAVLRNLRGRFAKRTRKVEIHDQHGGVLAIVDVPDDEASDQPQPSDPAP